MLFANLMQMLLYALTKNIPLAQAKALCVSPTSFEMVAMIDFLMKSVSLPLSLILFYIFSMDGYRSVPMTKSLQMSLARP